MTTYEEIVLPTKRGSIIHAEEGILVHQVNCMGKMGAGLAKSIRFYYPEVYKAYTALCQTTSPEKLLGGIQVVKVSDGYVINVFSQLDYGRDPSICYTDYKALQRALKQVALFAKEQESLVAVPYGMGAGLANGDWGKITHILAHFLGDQVVLYQKP